MIEFSLKDKKLSEDKLHVIRTGLIFKAGEYKDKKFTMSPEELLTIATDFKPVPIDYEHVPGPLDGKLGTLGAVTCSEDGEDLYGAVKLPLWLDEVLGNDPIKVSCTFDKATKNIEKLALTKNPRIKDAQLVAAFSASEEIKDQSVLKDIFTWFAEQVEFKEYTWHGKDTMQSLHDTAARAGAICDKTDSKAKFTTKAELSAIQQVHNLAVKNGANCYVWDDKGKAMYSDDVSSGNFKEKEKGKTMKISLKDLFSPKVSANLPDAEVEFSEVETDPKDKQIADLTAIVAGLAEKIETLGKVEEKPAEFKKEDEKIVDEEKENLRKELEAFKAKADAQKAKDDEAIAAKFADDNVKKILPKNREAAIALFSQLQLDDETNSTEVTFNVDKKAVKLSRADAFKQFVDSLPEFDKDTETFGSEVYLLGDKEKEFSEKSESDEELNGSLKEHLARQAGLIKEKNAQLKSRK